MSDSRFGICSFGISVPGVSSFEVSSGCRYLTTDAFFAWEHVQTYPDPATTTIPHAASPNSPARTRLHNIRDLIVSLETEAPDVCWIMIDEPKYQPLTF